MAKAKSRPCQHPPTARVAEGLFAYCKKCGKLVEG